MNKKMRELVGEIIQRDGALLSVVIDPVDYSSPEEAVKAGVAAFKGGADVIAVGGSIGAQGELLDFVTKAIKEESGAPIILFPGNIATISKHADALYFLSLLNSRNPYWISQAQMLAAPVIKKLGIEPLPVGYIVIEPGGTVGWVGDAMVVPRSKPDIAAALALAGQYSGCGFIFTDAGSAAFAPVPTEIVARIRKVIEIPLIVAGGIRTSAQAADIVAAGADWVQIGTAVEHTKDAAKTISSFSKKVKAEGKKRR